MFTHNHTTEIKTAAGKVLTDQSIYQGEGEENLSGVAAPAATTVFAVPIDVSKLKAFYIESDEDVALHTNASPAGADNFNLVAGKALIWNTDRGTNPLGTDVVDLRFVNAGPDPANIKAGFLLDL